MTLAASKVHIGPAGWAYRDWDGIVYPRPKRKGFEPLPYLARYFDTIEINSTYYHPARREVAREWAAKVADVPRFRFTVKLWKRFTHERGSAWTTAEVDEARGALEALSEAKKLGAVLIQFPWSFRRTEENREWLRDVLETFKDFPLVLEVRHSTWEHPDFFQGLAERGVGFVNIDQPLFHDSIKPSARATSRVGYVRIHGRNYKNWFRKDAGPQERYDYLYSAEELEPWVERTQQIAAAPEVKELYVVTNNHLRGKAPANALMMRSLLQGGKQVPAPDSLVETYPDVLAPFAVRQ